MALFSTRGKSPTERMIRMFLLLLVFLGVIWAFWQNNERVMDKLQARQSIWDETGHLGDRDRSYVSSFAASLRERFGLRLKLHVRHGSVEVPDLDSKTMFIAISPSQNEAVVVFPPLLRSGLGESFVEYVKTTHFERYFQQDQWPEGLRSLLDLVWGQLVRLENGSNEEDKSG